MKLTNSQNKSLNMFLSFISDPDEKEMAIKGYSGTGKTTIIKTICETIQNKRDLIKLVSGKKNIYCPIYLTATTNQAVNVLNEKVSIADGPAKTIYSLLGLRVVNDFKTGKTRLEKTREFNPIKGSLILIDEASFLSKADKKTIELFTPNCKIVYIGDNKQLLSVGESVSAALDTAYKYESTLVDIVRQDKGNPIIDLGTAFREAIDNGKFPTIKPDNKHIYLVDGPKFKKAVDHFFPDEKNDGNNKIISWTNDSVNSYNNYIRKKFTNSDRLVPYEKVVTNKPIPLSNENTIPTNSLLIVDVVSNVYTDATYSFTVYDVQTYYNGYKALLRVPYDVVTYKRLMETFHKQKDWINFFNLKEYYCDLRPTFSCTVHKSQGSTYNNCLINLDDIISNYKSEEVFRLLYVGVTRASNKVIFYSRNPGVFTK